MFYIMLGDSWIDYLTFDNRDRYKPVARYNNIGFRIVKRKHE